jgi:hypothetical protein
MNSIEIEDTSERRGVTRICITSPELCKEAHEGEIVLLHINADIGKEDFLIVHDIIDSKEGIVPRQLYIPVDCIDALIKALGMLKDRLKDKGVIK